jgi:hypothetical protein
VGQLRFEWDLGKSRRNEATHGVSFDETATVFSDEYGLFMGDPEHSKGEDRFILLGVVNSHAELTH